MAPSAQKLRNLNFHGERILIRLHQVYAKFLDPARKPAFVADQQFKKALQALTAKFPDLPDQIVGGEKLMSRPKEIHAELQPAYHSFVDAFNWKTLALETLLEIAGKDSHTFGVHFFSGFRSIRSPRLWRCFGTST